MKIIIIIKIWNVYKVVNERNYVAEFYVLFTVLLDTIFVNNQLDAQFLFIQTCTLNGHLYRVTYTRCRIDTINSPGVGHMATRNM
jgi:hypothetical protein